MPSQYIYRCFKTTWGIYVGMTAELIPYAGYEGAVIEAAAGVYLALGDFFIAPDEIEFLKLGVRLVEKPLREKLAEKLPVVIRIVAFDIAHTDYEPEGMVYVMVGWLKQATGIEYMLADPIFDKVANRYVFDFPEV